ncbi:MAG: hypothetical protein K2K56_07460 [Lachnospiraceae bacterium]|nr:hypothetical protein [Lachnospiraceae bacterium]
MTKQKKGFWVFFFSLIPGAGELYMGFQKMGLSIMILFWGCIACAALLGFNALIFLLPIIWFYSFFNVHNLKCLTEEEFLSVEDHSIFPTEELAANRESFIRQYRNILAILLIVFGVFGLWSNIISLLQWLLPDPMFYVLNDIGQQLPGIAISIILIVIGIRLVKGKKEELEYSERSAAKEQTSDVDTTNKKEIPAIEKSPSEESDDTGKEEAKDENA